MAKRRRKICITGAWYGSPNAGDQAILVTIRALLEKAIGEIDWVVFSAHPNFVTSHHPGTRSYHILRSPLRVFREIATADLMIFGGGTPFYDNVAHALSFTAMTLAALLAGTPVMVYAASAQKLRTFVGKAFSRFIWRHSKLVTVRERETFQTVEATGIAGNLIQTVDPAITLEPCEPEQTAEILKAEGVAFPADRPLLFLCPHRFAPEDPYRVHHYEKFAPEIVENSRRVLADLADRLEQDVQIVFLPMNTVAPDSDNDEADEILARMKKADGVRVIRTQYGPRQIAGLLSTATATVGVRLHSIVMSAAVKTPAIGIAYAPKVKGFLAHIVAPEDILEIYALRAEELEQRVWAILADPAAAKAALASRVERMVAEAHKNAERAKAILRPRRGENGS